MNKEIEDTSFKRELGLLDGTMLVVGSMIGSGIFIVSADIARQVGSAGWLILIWVLTGLVTVVAAVSYGELSAMFPKAGGQYVYLKEAYNKLIAFLYGWSFFAVIQTGTIAAVGVAFSKFAAYLYEPLSDANILYSVGSFHLNAAQLVSIVTIILLTYINSRGVKDSKMLQTFLTIIKIFSLLGLIAGGFLIAAILRYGMQIGLMRGIQGRLMRRMVRGFLLVVLLCFRELQQRWWALFFRVMRGLV
jgi:APA family basic amino acid/polyamine antiporter